MGPFDAAGSNGSLAENRGNTSWQSNALTRPEVSVQLPKSQVKDPKIKRKSPHLPTHFGKPEAVRTDHPRKIGSRRSKHWRGDPMRTGPFSRDSPVQAPPEPPIIDEDK